MPKIRISGYRDPLLQAASPAGGRFLRTNVREAVTVESLRAGGAPVELDVAEDDLLELTLEDDISWIVTYDRLRDDLQWHTTRGDAATAGGQVLELGQVIRVGEPSRGAGGLILKAIKVLGVDLPRSSAQYIAGRLESQIEPGPGLYHCPDPRRLVRQAEYAALAGDNPALLFLHGTASSTEGSFSGLIAGEGGGPDIWESLRRTYGDRMFAFEHHTLTISPLENAIELVEALPDRARLHLVSHSRGGIVGEILARGSGGGPAFTDIDFEVFDRSRRNGQDRRADIEAMRRLNDLFARKQIRVERFVRVACPAAGTTLASGRLDLYFNVLFNVIKRIPLLQQSLIFDFVADLLKAITKERMDPASLPGLEAQMPESPLIRVLNNPGHQVDSELSIIAGDVVPEGFVQRLLVLAADLFYRTDHDLVVNTEAMYGGTPRVMPPRFFFDKGTSVDHFHYFLNSRTQRALADALSGRTGEGSGFQPLPDRRRVRIEIPPELREAPPRTSTPRPVVFVLPGIMGSELSVRGDHVWVHLLRLARGGIRRLEIGDTEIEPAGLIGSAYADLVKFLMRTYRVIPFPYDWRKSIVQAADDLAGRVREELEATDQPVRFLAHSMGGLVGRAMIRRHPDVWDAMRARPGCRFIMLGTPNGGSYMIPEALVGRNKTLRKLALVDLKNDRGQILEIVVRYPGLLELLPVGDDDHDYFDRPVWEELHTLYETGQWRVPDADLLQAARQFHDEILQPSLIDSDVMCYVAGRAPFTPMGHDIVTDASGRRRVAFFATQEGDGRVPWSTGIPEALLQARKVWYMEVEHGKMAAHVPSFFALRDLLETGTTSRLSQSPPVERAATLGRFEMPELLPARYPDAEELEAEVVGFEPAPAEEAVPPTMLDVSVTHGDLAYARYPVVVGHFQGDGIVSAESVVDYYLGGRLASLYAIGLYPGEVGTARVVFHEKSHPPGAVVLGLGTPGELTAGKLARSVENAALLYAQRWHERMCEVIASSGADPVEKIEPPRLTTLLIGSDYGGLDMRTAIHAILSGVQDANRRLDEANQRQNESSRRVDGKVQGGPQRIAALEFIELFEDRAIQAMHVLKGLTEEGAFSGITFVSDALNTVPGGRHSAFDLRETAGWDTRIQIRERPKDEEGALPGLYFTALTERARAELTSLPTQRLLLDKLIRQAVAQPDWDPELAQALFELLIPNEFKSYAADRRNIIWVLDEAAAAYPWELLHDPGSGEKEPLAVRAGMLRQLASVQYRRQVEHALAHRALVIGEPDLGPDASFAPLPDARAEAKAVATQLSNAGYEVIRLLNAKDDEIIRKLLAYEYRILHLAGHGVYEHEVDGQKVTGMVIGPETFLTPAIIEQMRRVPEVVFVNCCHLGRVETAAERTAADRNRLAANLGTQLIQMGVRAVVVAGWAVQDKAARRFAHEFYNQMLGGESFREAVRFARAETYRLHRETNTWGAYQCYGHPYYTLREQVAVQRRRDYRFVAPVEAVVALQNFARMVESAAERNPDNLKPQLQAIIEGLKRFPDWQERPDVLEALARAHQALDLLPEALRYYEALTRPESGSCSTGALEELGALQVRLGVARAVDPSATPAERQAGTELAETGIKRLQRLYDLDPTHERMLRLGGASKRLARMHKVLGNDPVPALEQAIQMYREVFIRIEQRWQVIDHYPLLVWLTLEAVKGWIDRFDPLPKEELVRREKWIEVARATAAAREATAPTFWSLNVESDYLLMLLLDPNLPSDSTNKRPYDQAVQCKIETYGSRSREAIFRAWRRGGSFEIRHIILDEFDFLTTMLALAEGEEADTEKRRARNALASFFYGLREEVEMMMRE